MGVRMPGVEPRIKHSRDVYISAEFWGMIPEVYRTHLQAFCEDNFLGEGAHRASYTLPETAEKVISALATEYGSPAEIEAEKAAARKRLAEKWAAEEQLQKEVDAITSIEDAIAFFRKYGVDVDASTITKDPEELRLFETEEDQYYAPANGAWAELMKSGSAFADMFRNTKGTYRDRLEAVKTPPRSEAF